MNIKEGQIEMVEYKTGDIFTEDVEALVNSVNCVGVMGRGIALQFKNMFPNNFKAYAAACKRQEVQPGEMFVFATGQLTGPRYIINFPTKRHWRSKSRIEDIESGLEALAREIKERDIRSIAIPALGSDLGGLKWSDVRSRIERALGDFNNVHIIAFAPGSAPADGRPNRSSDVPQMTAGRATLIGLMYRYQIGLLDPFITLLEIHKLMYFMQEAGESLQLEYTKGTYGPYAENLRHVLRSMEGHLVTGYADGGDDPTKVLQLVPGAITDSMAFLNDNPAIHSRFDRVTALVEGFESSFGLELLATVHWVASRQTYTTDEEIVARTYLWNDRKRRLISERQILVALRTLEEKGWVARA